jgi:hypothetical protein
MLEKQYTGFTYPSNKLTLSERQKTMDKRRKKARKKEQRKKESRKREGKRGTQ